MTACAMQNALDHKAISDAEDLRAEAAVSALWELPDEELIMLATDALSSEAIAYALRNAYETELTAALKHQRDREIEGYQYD